MITLSGIYLNGVIKFDKDFYSTGPIKVIVTFMEEETPVLEKNLKLSDFNFSKSRKISEKFRGSISEAVIEERRLDL